MNPFKSLGDLNQMRKQAKQIQDALEQERYEVERGDMKIVMTGNQKVLSIEIDGEDQSSLAKLVNDAIKKSQQAAAMKLAQLSKGMGE